MSKLTDKQKAFVQAYCGQARFNATKAAELAGYSATYGSMRAIGSENLTKPNIQEAISKRLKAFHLSQDAALKLMADWARGAPDVFLKPGRNGQMEVDLSTDEAQQHLHLIKEIDQDRIVKMADADEEAAVLKIRTKIKLHDAKDATKEILKAHGAYGAKGTADDPLHHEHTHDLGWADGPPGGGDAD